MGDNASGPGTGKAGPAADGAQRGTAEEKCVDEAIQPGSVQLMTAAALGQLFTALHDAGFSVIGPTVRDDAIVLDELQTPGDLPFGWGVRLEPGGYRLRRRGDTAAFGHSAGPGSCKEF